MLGNKDAVKIQYQGLLRKIEVLVRGRNTVPSRDILLFHLGIGGRVGVYIITS